MPGFEPIVAWLRRFTEPSAAIQDPFKRQNARFVSVTTFGLVFVIGLIVLLQELIDPLPRSANIGVAVIICLVVLFALSRTIYYRAAAVALVVLNFIAISAAVLTTERTPFNVTQYVAFLVLSLLLANVLFTARWTVIIAVINLLLTWGLVRIALPDTDLATQVMIMRFSVLASLFVIAVAVVRHRDQEQISQAEKRYERLFEALADPVILMQDGKVQDVNPAFERAFGYRISEIRGHLVSNLITHEGHRSTESVAKSRLFETMILHCDGSKTPVEISSKSYTFEGQWVQVLTARDLSARHEAEAALEAERGLLRSVIDNIPGWIYVKDTDSRYILANRALREAYDGNLIDKTDRDFLTEEDAERSIEEERRLFESGDIVHAEERFISRIGEEIWFSVAKVPLYNLNGQVTRLLGVHQDITNRKRFEEHLRYHAELVNSIADAVFSVDMDLQVVSWNLGAERMYGWSADEVIGNIFVDFVANQLALDGTTDTTPNAAADAWTWSGEVLQHKRSGEEIFVLSTTSLITNDDGLPIGIVGVNRDVTERKRAEQQEVELTVERERVKILRQVISDMSHDLKNPLAAVRTSLYLLGKFADDAAKRQSYLDALDNHIIRLETMLQDLLSMSRLEHAIDTISLELVDISSLLGEVIQDQKPLAVNRNLTLDLHESGDLPSIMANPTQLNRAVTNLVVNALNYTPEGGKIYVTTERLIDKIVIEVHDTGIGISDADQERIFDRFYRADKSRNSSTGGSGLGLAIAKAIVESHGGEISVESAPGEGSVFRICLPLLLQGEVVE